MRIISTLSMSALTMLLVSCNESDNSTVNTSPSVSAGENQSVQERELVQLSGSASDEEGDNLTYLWTQVSGSVVEINNEAILTPTFRAPNTQNGEDIILSLTVSDGINTEVSDVTISVSDTLRDGASPQGINDGERVNRRDFANNRIGNRIMVGGIEVRTYDGSANNLTNTDWGAAFEHLQRLAPSDYSDSISALAGINRVSARVVSNQVHNQDEGESVPNSFGTSDFIWQWGQFIDHDIDLTDGAEESADIEVPLGDIFFDPTESGSVVIPFNRALFDPSTGTDISNPREQENEISSWIDGSMVYGSDDERAQALRDTENRHLLATSDGNLLPFNTAGLANANPSTNVLFLAGDVRVNEQASLTAMHTLFVREHNRMAEILLSNDPEADADDVFETARRLLIGKIQYITYNEWLPALIGGDAIADYSGYDASINPTIYNEFSAAAFRLGHTLLNEDFARIEADGTESSVGSLPLAEAFFAGTTLFTAEDDMDSILRGLASQLHQEYDVKAVTDIRNFLFGAPGAGGLDLPSLNIQRGRDHGLPSYNAMRVALGLTAKTAFSDISSDAEVVAGLTATYDSIDDIDLWTGGLAEDAVSDSQLGELFQSIMVLQFTQLRDGDRFWYEVYLPEADKAIVERTSLADIIRNNTSIGDELSDDVFRVVSSNE